MSSVGEFIFFLKPLYLGQQHILKHFHCVDTRFSVNSLKTDSCKYSSPKEISGCFNEFFCSIGTGHAGKIPKTNVDTFSYLINNTRIDQFDFLEISPEITAEFIDNSSAQKAVGYDGISMTIIKGSWSGIALEAN